ncbi:MAG: hypothetical protein IJ091_10155 [Oscillospiraceae bacterium]|nr:hypothetical protein [Oscillospiraceae bacterium]
MIVDCLHQGEEDGSKEYPFSRIQQAADIAVAGDEILVYPGIYREAVDQKTAGREDQRILYQSTESLKSILTGAEIIKG